MTYFANSRLRHVSGRGLGCWKMQMLRDSATVPVFRLVRLDA